MYLLYLSIIYVKLSDEEKKILTKSLVLVTNEIQTSAG